MSTPEQWRWTDDEGVQRLLRGDELRAAIADGRLKPTTLVWRRGMKSWVPAATVPELMDGLDDGPDTITKQRPKTLGLKSPPTPSIPPPALRTGPQNMVDINALRAASMRGTVSTLMGVGEKERAKERERRQSDVAIPAAPKMPKIDGGWREGAARPEREEDTVTALRTEDDPTTLGEANQPPKPAQKRSIPPPFKRTSSLSLNTGALNTGAPNTGALNKTGAQPAAATGSPVVKPPTETSAGKPDTRRPPPVRGRTTSIQGSGVNKTWVSPKDKPLPSVPPPVGSSEVLSERFDSRRDLATKPMPTRPAVAADGRAEAAKVVGSPVGSNSGARQLSDPDSIEVAMPLEPGDKRPGFPSGSRHPSMPTGPLPEIRPPEGSRPPDNPRFSNEPWRLPADAAAPAQAANAHTSQAVPAQPTVQLSARASQTNEARANEGKNGSFPPVERTSGKPAPAPAASMPPMAFITGEVQGLPVARGSASLRSAPVPTGLGTPTELPPRAAPSRALVMPYPIAAGVGAILLLFLVLFFVLGRVSAPSAAAGVAWAKTGWALVPGFARSRTASSSSEPRQCLMLRAPARFASPAEKSIPVEAARASGDRVAFGFARTSTLPGGILVDPATGTSELVFKPEEEEAKPLARVVPMVNGSEVSFGVTVAEQAGLDESVYVAAGEPFVLGFDQAGFSRVPKSGETARLWDLAQKGSKTDSLRAVLASDQRVAVSYRHANRVFYGLLDPAGQPVFEAAMVAEPDGDKGMMGRPSLAVGGDTVSLVFAQKPSAEGASFELRWARGALGEPLKDATLVDLPAGGPGGDAGAPDIAALGDGRWLLMWTEGRQSIRAQTYDRKFRPIGEALRVSPETGNFGQGALAVVGDKAVVVFLLQTGESYEVWGTVLQCG